MRQWVSVLNNTSNMNYKSKMVFTRLQFQNDLDNRNEILHDTIGHGVLHNILMTG